MKNKLTIPTILFIVFIAGFFLLANKKQGDHSAVNESLNQEKIKIAVCPTCFEITKNINTNKYEIIKTASTAESLAMLQDQKVDMILAGRTLNPNEPQMDKILI